MKVRLLTEVGVGKNGAKFTTTTPGLGIRVDIR